MLIKICGITSPEDAEAAIAAGADLLGFVFRLGTPRALDPATSGWIRDVRGVERVGVFLDSPLDEVMRARDLLALDWVQLHGDEPDTYLEALGEQVIRRVRVGSEIDWDRVAHLADRCLPLFDPGAGDGVAWAWEALEASPTGIRFGLAGGLTPDNVADAVRTVRPYLVDVSSGVESAPAIKDHKKIHDFISAAREVAS
ncbi:MAG: phosphoribosylanthranilate isomerase [Acidobacteria bacterium]|uniref:N-(5'-phosphoribosyl)anthranilate isomerase n=1 Tax=Candidatus Sulfomarinibacter kjeldsenii TaxID=2885994 RepID=A0A8J6Y5L2_9BACT|nr:phosphoribosylanthranilate isomerase [Candidatus Sulfomarinibacter kjeldsenii]